MMRVILQYTKLDVMGYISHLDFQRLWQRMFRIAGISVMHTQGYNPHPKIRFAVPLATGFRSENELLEVYLKNSIELGKLTGELNKIAPAGLEIISATEVPQEFPKLTALVDALEYRLVLPNQIPIVMREVGDGVETKGGSLSLSHFILELEAREDNLRLLIRAENQRTLRPDLAGSHFFPKFKPFEFEITRTGIFTRTKLEPVPTGLSILFD